MKDVTVDREGNLRCWHCGQMAFTEKRTFRAKVIGVTAGVATLGVAGAAAPLLTKKKLKCQVCGEYNDTGSAKPFTAPADRKWRKQMAASGELERSVVPSPPPKPPKPKPAVQTYTPPVSSHEPIPPELRQSPRAGKLGMNGSIKRPG